MILCLYNGFKKWVRLQILIVLIIKNSQYKIRFKTLAWSSAGGGRVNLSSAKMWHTGNNFFLLVTWNFLNLTQNKDYNVKKLLHSRKLRAVTLNRHFICTTKKKNKLLWLTKKIRIDQQKYRSWLEAMTSYFSYLARSFSSKDMGCL